MVFCIMTVFLIGEIFNCKTEQEFRWKSFLIILVSLMGNPMKDPYGEIPY